MSMRHSLSMRTSVISRAPLQVEVHDPSTRRLDKWRSTFHVFNLITFTVALISLGVSLLTYSSTPPTPSNVHDYALPMVYYGINGASMTVHTGFGVFACVRASNLGFLKIYTIVGVLLVGQEIAIGSWIVSTLDRRIDAVIEEIKTLEESHGKHDHDHKRKRRQSKGISLKRSADLDDDGQEEAGDHGNEDADHGNEDADHGNEDADHGNEDADHGNEDADHGNEDADHGDEEHDHDEEESGTGEEEDQKMKDEHEIYREINQYYGCCMYAVKWVHENQPFEEVYEHCLTKDDLFCGTRFILFPGGGDLNKSIALNCNCEYKVKDIVTERIVKQTVLLFIALPAQVLCLFVVALFIKFELEQRKNASENKSIPNMAAWTPKSKDNKTCRGKKSDSKLSGKLND